MKARKGVLWAARILGSLAIAFLLFMLVGHLLSGEDNLSGFQSTKEIGLFLLFPIGTLLGLGLAWKWEGLGGLIILISLLGFHTLAKDFFLIPWIDVIALPGLLYLVYWLLSKSRQKSFSTT